MASIVMASIVMASIVMAFVVMAYIVMAYILAVLVLMCCSPASLLLARKPAQMRWAGSASSQQRLYTVWYAGDRFALLDGPNMVIVVLLLFSWWVIVVMGEYEKNLSVRNIQTLGNFNPSIVGPNLGHSYGLDSYGLYGYGIVGPNLD